MNAFRYFLAGIYLSASLAGASKAYAAQCEKQSPAHRLALLELYTSEGCNSCPPADRWLRQIDTRTTADRDIVPLALHVDYWDSLGWRDAFSQHVFTERQEQLARLGSTHFSYTPEVFVSGKEFRGWRNESEFRAAMKAINSQPAAADIHLSWLSLTANSAQIRAEFSGAASTAVAYLAVYENRLSNKIGAGENQGATLQHDYVVRQWQGPIRLDGKTAVTQLFTPAAGHDGKRPDLGVAAFVQDPRTGAVLQALALPAC